MRIQVRGVVKRAYHAEKNDLVYVGLRTYLNGDWSLTFPGSAARELSALQGKEVDLVADLVGDVSDSRVEMADGRSITVPNQRITVARWDIKPVPAKQTA